MSARNYDPLDPDSLRALSAALDRLALGFADLPPVGAGGDGSLEGVLIEVAARLHDNYPYFHPLYAGQMLKPPHPVARLEKEAVGEMARMIGWESHLGHLCGGGTMANLEALWVSRELCPGAAVVA